MTSLFNDYCRFFNSILFEVQDTQEQAIIKGANLISTAIMNGGRFYVFGSGHSHMIAEEIYNRAGGLAFVTAILPPELMLHERPNKSTYLERIEGLSKSYLNLHQVTDKDVIMIVSNSGRNTVPVEMAIESRNIGAKIIAMTSMKHSKDVTSRHRSGKKLYELADVVLDNGAVIGDAGFRILDTDIYSGATSDAIGCFLAQALIVETLQQLVKEGFQPPVFRSSNVDGADQFNDELFDKYVKW
ncbi:MAG TPA: sugar isomerase domain-containing protein [Metabacillus sp.]|nr:sugar isomerase domain-containing protein [Metabacillus sp.]